MLSVGIIAGNAAPPWRTGDAFCYKSSELLYTYPMISGVAVVDSFLHSIDTVLI